MFEVILFGAFGIVSIGLIVVGIVLYRKYTSACTVRVIGKYSRTTTHYREHAASNDRYDSTDYYEYFYNGQSYEVRAHSPWESKEVDGGVEIFIDPSDPTRHYRKADLINALIFSGIGIAMFVIILYIRLTY